MKLLPHHPRHDRHDKQHQRNAKKSRKIMKTMARLERKLSKYNFDSSSSEDSTCSSDASHLRSRSLSRSHQRRRARSAHDRGRHGRRRASRAGSSSSSGAASDSSSSSSSSSCRSQSPCDRRSPGRRRRRRRRHRHRHHHGPPAHQSRSKSFAARERRSPSACSHAPPHHQPRHPHAPHHRGRFWRHRCRRLQDGLQGCFAVLAPESQVCDDPECSPEAPAASADQAELMDLASPSRSVSRERAAQTPVELDRDVRMVQVEADEYASREGPVMDETLAGNWAKILREGLPSEARKDLLKKYPISKNCSSLNGPRLNRELLPVACGTGVRIDSVQMHQQNQIGVGLTALGKAITHLNNKAELMKDQQVIDVLEELNEAAVIIADAHHGMTKIRQGLMQSELSKRVKPLVDNSEHDEFLYGKDFAKKIENIKGFGKGKKDKKHEREGRYGKGEKRKQTDQDGGRSYKHSTFHGKIY